MYPQGERGVRWRGWRTCWTCTNSVYHPERPVVCFDETSRQLTGEVRPPLEAAPGRMARYDTEYQRNGTRNLFLICEPKGGWRHVAVTERRTAVDFA